jgi:hypothetical protein
MQAMTKPRSLVIAMVIAILAVFSVHFLDFPGSVPRFERVSGGGVLLDVLPAFTVDGVYARLVGYGEAGRQSYTMRNVTVDLILPLSMLPFLYLLMLNAVRPLRLNSLLQVSLLSLSLTYVILDLAENAGVLMLLSNYPQRVNWVAGLLPYVTLVKRVASLLAIFVPLALIGIRFLRGKLRKPLLPV